MKIGPLDAFVVKACERCSIPDTDQQTAAVGKVVRAALKTRHGVNAHDASNKGVFFAQNLNHVYKPGVVISVRDTVTVATRSSEPNVVLDAARVTTDGGLAPRTPSPAQAMARRPGPATLWGRVA